MTQLDVLLWFSNEIHMKISIGHVWSWGKWAWFDHLSCYLAWSTIRQCISILFESIIHSTCTKVRVQLLRWLSKLAHFSLHWEDESSLPKTQLRTYLPSKGREFLWHTNIGSIIVRLKYIIYYVVSLMTITHKLAYAIQCKSIIISNFSSVEILKKCYLCVAKVHYVPVGQVQSNV